MGNKTLNRNVLYRQYKNSSEFRDTTNSYVGNTLMNTKNILTEENLFFSFIIIIILYFQYSFFRNS